MEIFQGLYIDITHAKEWRLLAKLLYSYEIKELSWALHENYIVGQQTFD